MTESITIDNTLSKADKYNQLLPQIEALVKDEPDITTNLAQICAALKYSMDKFFWVGFYFRRGGELVLGPFQGPVACSRIKIPNGVCGTAVQHKQTIIVDDVNKFPLHIACSSQSKSEIVIPIFYNDVVIAVLDVDSDVYSNFDATDKKYLEELCKLVSFIMSRV
jgi:L-methionine (R)-S-oxide reductase